MGYTHFYEIMDESVDLRVVEVGRDIAEVIRRCEILIGDANGTPDSAPEISSAAIKFNGVKPDNYERFNYPPDFEFNRHQGLKTGFEFCKTARRPYDIVVCAEMLALKHHLGDAVHISSDGSRKESGWRDAIALHDYIFRDRDGETLAGQIRKDFLMGWTFETEPDHIQNFINDRLREVDAFKAHIGNDPLAVTQRNIARDNRNYGAPGHDYIAVWYLADSAQDGKPYIGLLLCDYEVSAERNERDGMILNRHGDGGWPRTSPLAQIWGCKPMDASMQPYHYSCPVEYLDTAPPRSRHEREWYDEVRQRALLDITPTADTAY